MFRIDKLLLSLGYFTSAIKTGIGMMRGWKQELTFFAHNKSCRDGSGTSVQLAGLPQFKSNKSWRLNKP
jgi:hypothetical protein